MSTPAAAAHADHESFIKTPQQLLVVLFLSFAVPIAGILLLVYLVLNSYDVDPRALEAGTVAARLAPVGSLEVIDANAPKVYKSGEEVVKTVCAACHMTGAANAPKIGDKAAWAPLLRTGLDGMLKAAIAGKGAMPPRGGVPDLSDLELARAIVNMANQSGASLKEPPVPAPAPAATPTGAAPSAGSVPSSSGMPSAAPVGAGKAVAADAKKAADAAKKERRPRPRAGCACPPASCSSSSSSTRSSPSRLTRTRP
jgi:cytochrome c5